MTYWEYRKEKNREAWRNLVEWWEINRWIILMVGWMVPIFAGILLLMVSITIAIIIELFGIDI